MSTANVIGVIVLVALWSAIVVGAGICVGTLISRRNRRR